MRRSSAALGTLLVLAGALSACSGSDSGDRAQAVVAQLAGALTVAATPTPGGADASTAPDPLATVPFTGAEGAAVSKSYAELVAGMDGIAPKITVGKVDDEADRPTATLAWSWPVVEGADPWAYETTVGLVHEGDRWSVTWAPDVVAPDLAEGDTLDAVTLPTQRGDITGAGGSVLVTERAVVRVGIDRSRVPAAEAPASARALARLVDVDPAPFVKAVEGAGPRAFVEAITYRADAVPAAVRSRISSITGAHQVSGRLSLGPSRDFAAPILGRVGPVTAEMVEKDPDVYRSGDVAGLSGLQARYDEQLRGAPGRVVRAVPAAGEAQSRELYRHDPVAGKPLAITLVERLQTLAEQTLADVGPASALVAIRPSDGSILAAANGAGTGGQNYATFGQLAPGSTFKAVTSLALLRAGLTPDSTVRCTPTVTVNGKQFKNYSDYPASAIGTIPLREAIAQSCNTALINQRGDLSDGDLSGAAATLGLGIDHDLGFPSYFGEVPAKPASDTEGAADLIGQGKVLASPMAMATVIASVQAGKTVVPRLVDQVKVSVPSAATPLTVGEADQLKAMLRRVVTDGSGRGLLDVPGPPVIAKTGTAEYSDGGTIKTHAWMIAAQGDLAVAVFVQTGASGSQTAGPLLEAFLRGAR
ncbi:penicillin-binding protein [Pimelobacter simplex]|uniref:Cell division protein FtsI [Peptidoglycan synthetase] n=1 Tax=Nocardioides simplex TaxID=2045 RepID=A0A0A1DPW2_NOCSI|nr:penicillin-binding transpeptidase domain-containing protein [Pimelobacter simplex]AIY19409.1 Cell division protein FtsI [Peptidoglycan synthetase] [Pimelobacter simplex]MCG8149562.1 penicillin-binding protein [Pimelobacter simplex]GEB16073.1 cell division protein FtsI [Pimelobacter simplex]SFM17422.1 Cell division protein FtsI/penicillin-binding protein 2 [Pimelobacter simplex]